MYTFCGNDLVMSHLQTTPLSWQIRSIWHSAFFIQLHLGLWSHVFVIMSLYCFWDIVHATIADFNCIAIKNFVKFLASWKMFCYQLKECFWNVCWNGFAKGWIKPYYVLLSRFWFFWFVVGVFQINIITRLP